MPELVTPETGTEVITPTDVVTEPADTPKPTETVEFWKQKAREQEARAKSNATAAQRLQEIEDAQKSEGERLAEATATAKREAEEARAETLRYKAAATHQVSAEYFDLLGSGDEETIAARAERVGGLLKLADENTQLKAELDALRTGKPSPTSIRPVASLKPGATPENAPTEGDVIYQSLFGTN